MTREELIKKIQYFEEEMSKAPAPNLAYRLSSILRIARNMQSKSVKTKMKNMYEELLIDLQNMESSLSTMEVIGLKRRVHAAYKG
jgi:hypothetical protein